MTTEKRISVWVEDAERLADCVLGRAEGGEMLDVGLAGRLHDINPAVEARATVVSSDGLGSLRQQLEGGSAPLIESRPDLVVLSLAGEVGRFKAGNDPDRVVDEIRSDLVACIQLVKERSGARILVANLSTLDPDDPVYAYNERDSDPFVLVAHRLNLMLLGVSHDEGVSLIDIDRKIAEVGGGISVTAAARYNDVGCDTIASEMVRIIEDYGFLDDRPLMDQVGARGGSSE